ncbi:DUF1801 domain-containing protein [Candidatus Micrarchaeota archaeon]|nr:DUF1801 domain-containing protein [Candidatus Micrarchaeota archaeon]
MEVKEYIEKQKSPRKEILKRLRKIIKATFPKTKEEMRWGVPVFEDGKFYVVGLKDSVNLGFSVQGLTKKEMDNFQGKGKTMRHLKFKSLEEIDEKKIVKLMKMVQKKAKCEC